MASVELKSPLAQLTAFPRSLKSDEKGEEPLFLDATSSVRSATRVQETSATIEFRIAKKPGSAQL